MMASFLSCVQPVMTASCRQNSQGSRDSKEVALVLPPEESARPYTRSVRQEERQRPKSQQITGLNGNRNSSRERVPEQNSPGHNGFRSATPAS